MEPLLSRIDDRLVHARVLVGCCEKLSAERLLVVDDEVAGDPKEAGFFAAAAPEHLEVEFLSVETGAARIEELRHRGELATAVVLTRDAATMRRLIEAGASLKAVVVGGVHREGGVTTAWDELRPLEEDLIALRALVDRGVEVAVQRVVHATRTVLDRDALEALLRTVRS